MVEAIPHTIQMLKKRYDNKCQEQDQEPNDEPKIKNFPQEIISLYNRYLPRKNKKKVEVPIPRAKWPLKQALKTALHKAFHTNCERFSTPQSANELTNKYYSEHKRDNVFGAYNNPYGEKWNGSLQIVHPPNNPKEILKAVKWALASTFGDEKTPTLNVIVIPGWRNSAEKRILGKWHPRIHLYATIPSKYIIHDNPHKWYNMNPTLPPPPDKPTTWDTDIFLIGNKIALETIVFSRIENIQQILKDQMGNNIFSQNGDGTRTNITISNESHKAEFDQSMYISIIPYLVTIEWETRNNPSTITTVEQEDDEELELMHELFQLDSRKNKNAESHTTSMVTQEDYIPNEETLEEAWNQAYIANPYYSKTPKAYKLAPKPKLIILPEKPSNIINPYPYTTTPLEKAHIQSPEKIHVYPDGSAMDCIDENGNTEYRAGAAIWIPHTEEGISYQWDKNTIQHSYKGELTGLYKATTLPSSRVWRNKNPLCKEIHIYTDCKSAIQLLIRTIRMPWKHPNNPMKPLALHIVYRLLMMQRLWGITVYIHKVPGHTGIIGNEKADAFAKLACTAANTEEVTMLKDECLDETKYLGPIGTYKAPPHPRGASKSYHQTPYWNGNKKVHI
jgi:ribonuclease HI